MIGLLWLCVGLLSAAGPVFETGVAAPTKDKPQSKLWFAGVTWWAWMPSADGSVLWRRGADGWERRDDLRDVLRGLPGQADVWALGNEVAAVLVEKQRLAFVRARLVGGKYVVVGKPVVFTLGSATETATVVRDGGGRWWIAYNERRRMWVRSSADGERWGAPVEVSVDAAAEDDICAIAALPGGVGVIWSDQAADAVLFRFHGAKWGPVETVARGNKTADDHFHTALAADGRLFVATKNSLDTVGEAQLVLRVRSAGGKWTNYPYARRTAEVEPSRPIALIGGERLFLLHSVYRRKGLAGFVAMLSTGIGELRVDGEAGALIAADGVSVNNVTGSKAALPTGVPWIVLASDEKGRVYEGEIGN